MNVKKPWNWAFMSKEEKEVWLMEQAMKQEEEQKEKIRKMKEFASTLDKTCSSMNKAAEKIFAKAKEATKKGNKKLSTKLLKSTKRMQHLGENLESFKLRVECCIEEMKAYESLAAIPNLVKNIDGFLSNCPNFAQIKYDMKNFGKMMSGMERSLSQLEKAMDIDNDDAYESFESEDDALNIKDLEKRLTQELADEINIGTPVGNSAKATEDASIDSDADAFARMMIDETSDD